MAGIDTAMLKQHAPIVPYIKRYYKKCLPVCSVAGSTVFCRCIWHEENTASLAFFKNGTYKCFGCGEHGDIITLVQKIENISFKEACKMIGDNVGYEIIIEEPNPAHEQYKNMMGGHVKRYMENLSRNPDALHYLMNTRGINSGMIDLFQIGLTADDEYRYRNTGNISGRISFPIFEHSAGTPRCVGMGYRTIKNEKPKYVNDINQDGRDGQDTALNGVFIKGNMLYGYPQALKSIKDTGYAIVTEGYLDVVSMHQSGLTNTVGIMGTSLSDAQVNTLAGITGNIMLFLDCDKAGIKAAEKALLKLYSAGLNTVLCMPGVNGDPADICMACQFDNGRISRFIEENTVQSLKYLTDTIVKQYENVAASERLKAMKHAEPFINAAKDKTMAAIFKEQLMKRLDMHY